MNATTLLDTLREVEVETHQPHVRADPVKLGQLLYPNFFEISRSGSTYSRDEVLAEFGGQPSPHRVWSQDFRVEALAGDFALLTYRSAHISDRGTLDRYTLRASLWQSTDKGWRIRFHQGTPTEEFESMRPNSRCRGP
jgi:hypothetical protein